MSLWPLQAFDPSAEFVVFERKLPHWAQAGTVAFITWRTKDSIPQSVLNRWHADRDDWLRKRGINPKADDWRQQLQKLDRSQQGEFVRTFSERWHRHLDACHGACVLRQPELSQIAAESLLKFDGDRYELTDFIVMPNHVHLLAAFATEEGMLNQCEGWKHFQATMINRKLGGSGRFWQQDGFDHLVRSSEQFDALRRYIAANPSKARLSPSEFRHYSKPIPSLKKSASSK
jgi:REP element-mobilizing transposase RayT